MKVEELQNYLSQFNPKSDFNVIDSEGNILNFNFGWSVYESINNPNDKMENTNLYLIVNPNYKTVIDDSNS